MLSSLSTRDHQRLAGVHPELVRVVALDRGSYP